MTETDSRRGVLSGYKSKKWLGWGAGMTARVSFAGGKNILEPHRREGHATL